MGFWGAVFGGVAGALVAGPVGAAIGAGIGGMAEGEGQDGDEQLPMELNWQMEPNGMLIGITPQFPVPCDVMFVLHALDDSGRHLKGAPQCADGDGDFIAFAPMSPDETLTATFIAAGGIRSVGATFNLRILTVVDDEPVGYSLFEVPSPPSKTFSACYLIEPLIELAMRVARADGVLDKDEVALIRGYLSAEFELRSRDHDVLKNMMKTASDVPTSTLVSALVLRLPLADAGTIMEFLAGVAKADGHIHPNEVEVCREVALAFGLPHHAWDETAYRLGLVADPEGAAGLGACYEILGVHEGASLREVKLAYRAKMKDFHPDKVATLAPEFREFATRKSQEFGQAYETLCAALKS